MKTRKEIRKSRIRKRFLKGNYKLSFKLENGDTTVIFKLGKEIYIKHTNIHKERAFILGRCYDELKKLFLNTSDIMFFGKELNRLRKGFKKYDKLYQKEI